MRPLTILSVCAFLFSCSTPTELLEEGKTEKAFALASKKLKSGIDVNTNSIVLIEASKKLIQNELTNNFPLTQSNNVKHWVTAQNNYFKTLEDIVAANNQVDGKLQNSYDQLCTQKIDLDFKIADHFYMNGDDLLAAHYEQLSKHHTREAYFHYQECQSFGGDRFFHHHEDTLEKCV